MKELIKKVLENYKGKQLNMDSDAAIKILVDDIEKTVKKKYYVIGHVITIGGEGK